MGFSSLLQGRAAHEALLVRQDAELRLLDTMKRCLTQKVKCDKEYAIALTAASQQGLKIDRADDLQGSLITKAWRAIMEEWDQTAKQLKSKAELLESVCQDKLTHLYQDKRKARKTYQEEHSKIAAQFTTLTEEVAKKKVEYQKHLEYYKVLRSRFEEHYIKSGRGGRKLDDVRDKYQKACRKLHLAHNEYVLLISEAIEVEKDFRTILLPGLLEHQQSIQENFIADWKNILLDASRHGDFTADKFQEIQRRIESNLQNVNPAEEYREFTEKHKTSPAAPVIFQFDQSLIEDKDSLGNKLQPNSLTVDNLTVDWLRLRLTEFESSIKECQEKQTKLMENGTTTSPITPVINGVNGGNKDMNKQSKDLNTLRCQERQMLKLADMIKTALNEVGCEELPSGCDDLSVDQGFIENNVSLDQPDHHNSSFFLQKGAEVISMIKAPFKRKSAPISSSQSATSSSPKTMPRRRGCSVTRSVSLGSSVNSLNMESISGALAESDIDNMNCSNIYAEIDVNNSVLVCANNKPINHSMLSDSSTDFDSDSKMCLSSDGEVRSNGSKNNLLEVVEVSDDIVLDNDNNGNVMWSGGSVDTHLDNIDKINKILDEKILGNTKKEVKETTPTSIQISRFIVTKLDESVLGLDTDHLKKKLNVRDSNDDRKTEKRINVISEPYSENHSTERRKPEAKDRSSGRNVEKKNRFIANKSVNAFLTSVKELKLSRKKSDEDVFEEIASEPVKSGCIETTSIDGSTSSESTTTSSLAIKASCFEDDAILISQSIDEPQAGSSKQAKSTLKSRLKHKIKSKLKFNIKLTSSKPAICQRCLKQRKAHPKNLFGIELTKEWSGDGLLEIDLCCCSVDDLSGMTLATNRPLYEEEWFHGVLPREEVVRLLKNEGDFLVRETIRNEESQIVLSVCWNGHKHFIVQITADGHYRFEGPAFPSIQELIMHQHQSEAPVTGRSGAVLKKPVLRERWELSNDDVILQDKIGRGNFGDVYKARLKSSKKQVAVKTCRMTLPEEQKRKFLQEGRILKQYDHPNIVKLIGICVQKQPIMIVMELVPGGSLLNYLRKNATTLNTKQLMSMCRDAASGMRYLESKNCIHRDLAARNCLIGYENIVKISDFGMSREEEEYIVSDGMKQIPIKWTAPEALNFGKYTSLCDVWSYGILMWEIFTGGDTPYTGMSNSRARERIDSGYRMPAPDNTPQEMHRLMLKCWSYEPEARPHFEEIYNVVEALLAREM